MSIIEEIYNGQYQPQAGGPVFPRDMREEDLAFWKKVTEALGDDFADAHLRRMCKKRASPASITFGRASVSGSA